MTLLRRLIGKSVQGFGPDGGNVAILFAIALPMVVGGAGLGVETSFWRFKQLELQGAADAAAYAGSVEKRAGSVDAAVTTAATQAAVQNGFDAATGTITVSTPPTAGGQATTNALAVELTSPAPRFFTAYFTNTALQLRARAVAVFDQQSAACILALDPAAPQAVLIAGNAEVTLQGCNLMANSIAGDAVTVQGSAELTAPCLVSGGGAQLLGTVSLTACTAPLTQAPRVQDPYRTLAAPTSASPCRDDNAASLQPGNYCAGMQLNGTQSLQPGVYIVSGGDLHINAGANITGTGVTIYLQGTSRLTINGHADVDLTAPTSGTYSGVLFFGDRSSLGGRNVFNGTASSHLTGALYFPSQAVEYLGNFSGQDGCTQVVARTVQWSGNSEVGVDCSSMGMQTLAVMSVVKLVE